MSISVQCSRCQKRYRVDDRFAGGQAKCKNCGHVLHIPALSAADGVRPAGGDVLPLEGSVATAPEGAAADESALVWDSAGHDSAATAPPFQNTMQPPPVASPLMDLLGRSQPANAEEGAVDESVPPQPTARRPMRATFTTSIAPPTVSLVRPNKLWNYPFAAFVDDWLPIALIVVGFGPWLLSFIRNTMWASGQWAPAIAGGADQLFGQVTALTAGIFFLIVVAIAVAVYYMVVVPITLVGVRIGGKLLHFDLPDQPGYRLFAVFVWPLTLGHVMLFLTGGSEMAYVFGVTLGLLTSFLPFWVLFRLRFLEAIVSYLFAGIFYIVSVCLSALVVLLIFGTIIYLATPPAQRHGGFTLIPRRPPTVDRPPQPPPQPPQPPVPQPPVPQPPVPQPPVPQPPVPQPPVPQPPANPNAPPLNVAIALPPAPPVLPPDAPPVTWKAQLDAPARPLKLPPQTTFRVPIPDQYSQAVVFPSRASRFAVIGQNDGPEDMRVVADLTTGQRAFPVLKGVFPMDDPLALSADGAYLAGVTNASQPVEVGVLSFRLGNFVRKLQISQGEGRAQWLDFAGPNQVVVCIDAFQDDELEVWNFEKGVRVCGVKGLKDVEPKGLAVSPNSRYVALISKAGQRSTLGLYDLTTGSLVGQSPVPPLEEQRFNHPPTCNGLAFSPDGAEIVGLFSPPAQGAQLVVWDAVSGQVKLNKELSRSVRESVFARRSRAIEWMDNNQGWLLYGRSVVDRRAGDLVWTLTEVRDAFDFQHKLLDNNHLVVVGRGLDPKQPFVHSLMSYPLPMDKIEKAAEGMRPTTQPATQP